MSNKNDTPEKPEKIDLRSMDVAGKNREKLKELFPSVFTEKKKKKGELVESIDFEKLKAELGTFSDVFESRRERYGMDWPGKKDCMKIIQQLSVATLKPCREESVNFDTTENLFIEGDNLEVLKLLQKSYYGKVKMIYIDPPYNTGKEFIYPDKYSESLDTYLEYAGLVDDQGRKFSTNTANEGRFHTRWLNMMYPRLYLARNLLREDGAIFISIDDNELLNLRKLCNEIFGEENFVSVFVWDGGRKNDSKKVSVGHEYIISYTKKANTDNNDPNIWKERKEGIEDIYNCYDDAKKKYHNNWDKVSEEIQSWFNSLSENHPSKKHKHYRYADANGVYFASDLSGPDDGRKNRPRYQVLHPITGKPVPIPSRGWRWEEQRMIEEIKRERVHFGKDEGSIPNGKVYLKENEYQAPSSVFYKDRRSASMALKTLFGEKIFDFPKDTNILKRLISLICRDGDIVLDFFAGSGSFGEAVLTHNYLQPLNIQFILIQLPEPIDEGSRPFNKGYRTIASICIDRLRRVINELQSKQVDKVKELGSTLPGMAEDQPELDLGFKVLKLDRSNFKIWDKLDPDVSEKEIAKQLTLHIDHINEGSSQEDILYELLLKAGFMPTEKVEKLEMAGKTVFSIADGGLLICLEDEITSELIDAVAAAEPMQFYCLDMGFHGNDQLKANAVQTFSAYNQGREKTDQIVFRTV